MRYIGWLITPFKRAFDFSGRSDREEFVMFLVTAGAITLALAKLDTLLLGRNGLGFSFVFALLAVLPLVSLAIRRLNDTGYSRYWVLLLFLGILAIIPLVLLSLAGPAVSSPCRRSS